MSMTHATALRNDIVNLVTGAASVTFAAGTGQSLKLYSGTPPANAAAGLSGNSVVSTITALVWGTTSGGICSITSSTADSSAVGGLATFFRILKSDGTTVIDQGLVGTSGSDFNISSGTTITAGSTVTLASGSYTAPN